MDFLTELKQVANLLDQNGLYKQADLIDEILLKKAQNAPAELAPTPNENTKPVETLPPVVTPTPPPAPKETKQDAQKKLARTTFLMYQELRDFYVQNLKKFHYFGDDNIKVLQTALDQLLMLYRVVLRTFPQDYDKEALGSYQAHLKQLEREIDRSAKMKITPVKVKIDKFLIFDELEILMNKIERQYDQGVKELQPILRKVRGIRDAFANIIQQTSEQIAHADLIETH